MVPVSRVVSARTMVSSVVSRVVRVVSGWYPGWYVVPIYTRHNKEILNALKTKGRCKYTILLMLHYLLF